jgi:TM2 domain-containing membrane protein YozV
MSTINCPSCGAPVDRNLTACKYCGEPNVSRQPQSANTYNHTRTNTYSNMNATMDAEKFGEVMNSMNEVFDHVNKNMHNMKVQVNNMQSMNVSMTNMSMTNMTSNNMNPNNMNTAYANQMYPNAAYPPYKSKVAAGLLGIFLGGFGIHKFYLGSIGWGIVYLLFGWTMIPSLVGFIEGIVYLASSDESFNMKYGRRK